MNRKINNLIFRCLKDVGEIYVLAFSATWFVFLHNFRGDHIVTAIVLSNSKLTHGDLTLWRMAAFDVVEAKL